MDDSIAGMELRRCQLADLTMDDVACIQPCSNNFNLQYHLVSRSTLRIFRAEATARWQTLLPRQEPEMRFIPPFPILLT
jgi:hypothetical protein